MTLHTRLPVAPAIDEFCRQNALTRDRLQKAADTISVACLCGRGSLNMSEFMELRAFLTFFASDYEFAAHGLHRETAKPDAIERGRDGENLVLSGEFAS